MADVYPCVMYYCLEKEVETTLTIPWYEGLVFAIDRFRSDEERFGVGLTAEITTNEAGTVYLGSASRKGAAYLAYVPPAAAGADRQNRRYVSGGSDSAGFAEFHLFYPDCPSYLNEYETMSWPRARDLALSFAKHGEWPADIEWVVR